MTSASGLEPGDSAADFTLKNANLDTGMETMSLADVVGDLGGIIAFTCNHCPYVVASEARIEKMAERCRTVGFGFVGINSNDPIVYTNDDWDHMVDRAKSMSYPYLHDPEQTIAHAYGAQRTPEFYLVDSTSKIVYRGRMDDSPRDPNAASTNELDDAMEALISGEIIQTPRTESIGCSVKWK